MTGTVDVLVVGARAAGAATALLLARAGARVLVIDRGQYGSDTLSTHSLMRPAVLQLARWGVLPRIIESGATAIRGSRFYYGDQPQHVEVRKRDGIDVLYAPRRTALDRALVDAALAAGAQFSFGSSLRGLERVATGMRARAATPAGELALEARLVVGADGRHSRVAELVGAPLRHRGTHASAVVYGYWRGLELTDYWWSYGQSVSAGAIPTNDGETCVFASIPSPAFREVFGADLERGYHDVIAAADGTLARLLAGGRRTGALHGFPGSASYRRGSYGPGWALAGDAWQFKDPITAHGLTDALLDAELLSRAAIADTTAAFEWYDRERTRLSMPVFEISDRMASYEWDAADVESLLRALSEAMAAETQAILEWPAWPSEPPAQPSFASARRHQAAPPAPAPAR